MDLPLNGKTAQRTETPGNIYEVGPPVASLASEKASYINSANFRVDAGTVSSI